MQHLFKLLLVMMLLVSTSVSAQVTIGSGRPPSAQSLLDLDTSVNKKGLHLPRLTTAERDALTEAETGSTRGLAIYNIDSKCYEYWNEMKWVSLCTSSADIRLDNAAFIGGNVSHLWEGVEAAGPVLPVEIPEPSCGTSQPLSVIVISGSSFLSVDVIDASTGLFTYSLDANTSYNSRTAVIRILDNCTQEYKDFLVRQDGNTTVCDGRSGTPEIDILGSDSSMDGVLCAGGQAVLSVANADELTVAEYPNDFVWVRNGLEVGRGTTFYVTQSGNYQLFLGGIGCPSKSKVAAITWQDSPPAPEAVLAIDADNNGMVCSGAPITLTAITSPAYTPPAEFVQWMKNGELISTTGLNVSGVTEVGAVYSAFVVNSSTGCVSRVSNGLLVREGTGTKPELTKAGVLINGVPMSSNPTLCPGSTIRLEVSAPQPELVYEWYVNSNRVGMGSILYHNIPANESVLVIQCVVSGTGCITSVTLNGNLTVVKPAKPVINASSSFVCAASTLTLSTDLLPGVTYQWFRNGLPISGQTANTLTISNAGSFEVQASVGACQSDRSEIRNITLSGAPTTVVFTVAPAKAVPNVTVPFQATGINAESWIWDGDGKVSEDGNGAEYSWATAGQKTVTATARNACGATSVSATIEVEDARMAQPTVQVVAAAACGGGAEYKVDLNAYSDIDILTGFNWTVTRAGVPISFRTFGEMGETVQFEYTAPGGVPYSVQAVAVGVGKVNSEPSEVQTITPTALATRNFKLRGIQIFDVAQTGADLEQREANITPGGTYSYSIYDGGTAQTSGSTAFNFPAVAGATYSWSVDDPNGLLTNAAMINSATTASISLTFGNAINSITNGQSKTVRLSCVITVNGCPYVTLFPVTVQDRFACGTGGYPTKLLGTKTPYGDRREQRKYDTYTFPTSDTDPTPKCWMIEDSAEGTNENTAGACDDGSYARQTDNGRGFHYRSDNNEKHSACLPGWHLPVGGNSPNNISNTTELGNHFRNLQTWPEYKAMWYKNYTAQHGYDCTPTYYAWDIWVLAGSSSTDHEGWIERNTRNMQPGGDATHNSFSARCVKDNY
ncbi:MAG: hypothetical protein LBR75_02020 [Prevotellaceae bacterium]|nr:hypothetical protein [Prevotellaceae bacterium]